MKAKKVTPQMRKLQMLEAEKMAYYLWFEAFKGMHTQDEALHIGKLLAAVNEKISIIKSKNE